jgi:multicomponent Na+:H+ antiporter subunit B
VVARPHQEEGAVVIPLLFVVAVVAAIVALQVRDLLAAAALLSVFSFVMALLYGALGAVDVGFNEAVLGAGVTGVLLVVALFHTRRRSVD